MNRGQLSYADFFILSQGFGKRLENTRKVKNAEVGTIWAGYFDFQDIAAETLGSLG